MCSNHLDPVRAGSERHNRASRPAIELILTIILIPLASVSTHFVHIKVLKPHLWNLYLKIVQYNFRTLAVEGVPNFKLTTETRL